MSKSRQGAILGMRVDPTSYQEAVQLVMAWAKNHESRYVCVANVHMVMEAHDAADFRQIVNQADLVTPDGMPLVWVLRRHFPQQERVYGPELTLRVCEAAAKASIPVGFYGGRPETLETLVHNLTQRFPGLQVVYAYSPPFRPLTPEEDEAIVQNINQSGAKILFVGLGCPKQERWMAEHRGKVQAVMLGVGAAFDLHGGRVRQAPAWMQRAGLEWLFRLWQEPGRLWKRYFKHNPRFIMFMLAELLGLWRPKDKEEQ